MQGVGTKLGTVRWVNPSIETKCDWHACRPMPPGKLGRKQQRRLPSYWTRCIQGPASTCFSRQRNTAKIRLREPPPRPMPLARFDVPFEHPDWIFEPKM